MVETIDKAVKGKGGKVPKAPKTQAIDVAPPADMTDEDRKLDLQSKIAEAQRMLSQKAAAVGTQKETVAELYDGLPASSKVAELEEQLEAAKADLKEEALRSKEIEGANEVLAEVKTEKSHWEAMLSLYLVQWATRYKRRDVTVGDQRLEIKITAKLGNVVDELQAELPLWETTD